MKTRQADRSSRAAEKAMPTYDIDRAMQRVMNAQRRALEALEHDRAVDWGEFSAPAIRHRLDTEVETIALEHGFADADELWAAAKIKTSERWSHYFAQRG